MKLYLGSNKKLQDGYVNVDILDIPGTVNHDLTKFPYPFEDNSAEEILSEEVLEHISFLKTDRVLSEWYRILAPLGKLQIQVPDIGRMCEYYAKGEICDCVPQKAPSWDAYKANPDCFKCGGRGKIHPKRWYLAFSGAQKHDWDAHLAHFTRESLEVLLDKVGFVDIYFEENPYKIVIKASK